MVLRANVAGRIWNWDRDRDRVRSHHCRTALPIHLLLSVFSVEIYFKHGVRPGCSTDCHLAHARPKMHSILLVNCQLTLGIEILPAKEFYNTAAVSLDDNKELELQARCCAERFELASWSVCIYYQAIYTYNSNIQKFRVQRHMHVHAHELDLSTTNLQLLNKLY